MFFVFVAFPSFGCGWCRAAAAAFCSVSFHFFIRYNAGWNGWCRCGVQFHHTHTRTLGGTHVIITLFLLMFCCCSSINRLALHFIARICSNGYCTFVCISKPHSHTLTGMGFLRRGVGGCRVLFCNCNSLHFFAYTSCKPTTPPVRPLYRQGSV